MEYLLDTHAFLWFVNGSIEISQKARDIIQNMMKSIYITFISCTL